MKERGLIIGIGDGCQMMLLPYWRCLLGHKWRYSIEHERWCERCNKRMCYEIVDFGRSKTWVWRNHEGKQA